VKKAGFNDLPVSFQVQQDFIGWKISNYDNLWGVLA
jgi:hypothetical protein